MCTRRAGSDPRPRTTVPGRTQTEHHRPRTREASGEGCIYSSSVRVRSSGQRGRVPVRLRVRERRVMSPTGYHARRHQDAAAASSVSGSPQPRSEGANRTTTGRVNRGAVRPGLGLRRPRAGPPARPAGRQRGAVSGTAPARAAYFLDIFSRHIFSLSRLLIPRRFAPLTDRLNDRPRPAGGGRPPAVRDAVHVKTFMQER